MYLLGYKSWGQPYPSLPAQASRWGGRWPPPSSAGLTLSCWPCPSLPVLVSRGKGEGWPPPGGLLVGTTCLLAGWLMPGPSRSWGRAAGNWLEGGYPGGHLPLPQQCLTCSKGGDIKVTSCPSSSWLRGCPRKFLRIHPSFQDKFTTGIKCLAAMTIHFKK